LRGATSNEKKEKRKKKDERKKRRKKGEKGKRRGKGEKGKVNPHRAKILATAL